MTKPLPTPVQLRTAADEVQHALATSGAARGARIADAMVALPAHSAPWRALWELATPFNIWTLEAIRLRLLVEALHTEQQGRRERVGSGYRDCIRDGACAGCGAPVGALHEGSCDWERCGKCHGQVIACGCEVEEMCALIGEFMQEGAAP